MPSRPAVNGATPRILAITDDPRILALLRDLLKVEGYHIAIHVSVDDDLTEITTLQPNVIILDCVGALEDAPGPCCWSCAGTRPPWRFRSSSAPDPCATSRCCRRTSR